MHPVIKKSAIYKINPKAGNSRSNSPSPGSESPPPENAPNTSALISQRLSEIYSGSIIRRVLCSTDSEKESYEITYLKDETDIKEEEYEDEEQHMKDEEKHVQDTDLPLDLSLNAEEKSRREQTQMLKKDDRVDPGTESDDSGGPGEDRGRAYKKSLMKRYRKYL